MRKQKMIAAVLVILVLQCVWAAAAVSAKTETLKNSILEYIAETTPTPDVSTIGGEWAVLCLARGGYYTADAPYFGAYTARVAETVRQIARPDGALHRAKSTENSRLILALTAIGADVQTVGGVNLLQPYANTDWIGKQGSNGFAFALLALDSKPYDDTFSTVRTTCVENLLARQTADGGWTLSGDKAETDLTAMVLQSLYPYREDAAVAAAAARGFAALSALQKTDGTFSGSCESAAQVVTACCTWKIDPDTDARFVKTGGSAWDGLCAFYLPQSGGFAHSKGDTEPDAMATEQGGYAVVAYDRFLNGQTALYDMSDVTVQPAAPTTVPTVPTTQQTATQTTAETEPSAATTTETTSANAATEVPETADRTTHPRTTVPETTKAQPMEPTAATVTQSASTAATPHTGEQSSVPAALAVLVLAVGVFGWELRRKRAKTI